MKTAITTMMLLLTFAHADAFGADKTKPHHKNKMTNMTPEQRQSMATVHEKMAVCLRSDKPMEDCKKEMMQTCEEMMGKDGCPMMNKMHNMEMMHDKDKGKEDSTKK